MSTFKRGSSPRAASPPGFVALALACGCFAFTGCPVDDRSLDVSAGGKGGTSAAASGGTAGASRGGAQPSGEGGSGGALEPGEGGVPNGQAGSALQGGNGGAGSAAGGTMGQSGSPEPGGGGCEDLDADGVEDCQQTIAQNSRFMTDVVPWEPEPTLQQAWDERDASDVSASGAMRVRNTNVASGMGTMLSGSRQCLPAVGGEAYRVAVNTLIPGGQGAGSAGVAVWFFGSDGCSANSIGTITLQLVSQTDVWSVAHGKFSAPGGTRSMHVRLVTAKPFEQPSLEALFDDVLVRRE